MYYPQIEDNSATRQMLSVFRGYNHNPVIGEGEFSKMENMSSEHYPLLASRSGRNIYNVKNAEALVTEPDFDELWWIDKDTARLRRGMPGDTNIEAHDIGLSVKNAGKHFIVTHGAYAIVFPEGKYYNIAGDEDTSYGDLKNIGGIFSMHSSSYVQINIDNCERDGTYCKYATDPDAPKIGEYKLTPPTYKRAADGTPIEILTPPRLYRYVKTEESVTEWVEVTDTYVRISASAEPIADNAVKEDFTGAFEAGDLVKFNNFPVIWGKGEGMGGEYYLPWLNGTHVITAITNDNGSLVISGIVGDALDESLGTSVVYESEDGTPTIESIIPELDYVISCGNRLWGCRYGANDKHEVINEIYATKLGDIRRWHTYADGSPADNSWAASVGMPGEFTGAAVYDGRPYFFKENRIFTVYGNSTTEFTLQEIVESGIEMGSDKSVAVLNGLLYYKSRRGILAFNGTSTQLVSDALGNERYSDAVAGTHNGRYYVSMKDVGGAYHLFAFDTRLGLWNREDDLCVSSFAEAGGELYCISDGHIYNLTPAKSDERVRWYAESGIIGLDSPDRKYVSRIALRMVLGAGAKIVISVQYDSMGDFLRLYGTESQTFTTFTIPVPLRRHDHMRLRLEGEGDVRIFSITKTIEEGGDM